MANPGEQRPFQYSAKTLMIAMVVVALGMWCLLSASFPNSREARRVQCRNNLKQIGLALICYEAQWGCYPPAYIADEKG